MTADFGWSLVGALGAGAGLLFVLWLALSALREVFTGKGRNP